MGASAIDTKEYYDSAVRFFDDDFPEEQFARHVAAALSVPRSGGFVLDVGCGGGGMFRELALCGASEIHGIDLSGKMVELARRRAAADPRVTVAQEDFLRHFMPGYDVIMAFAVYDHFPDPNAFIYHAHTLLRRGGRLTVAFPNNWEETNLINEALPAGITRRIASADREALRWENHFKVDCVCGNDRIYLISGTSR